MKNKEEIKEILEQAKELHLESVEIDGIKYTLGKNIGFPRKAYVEEMKAEEIVKPMSAFEEPNEEEILYWATPFYDQLQAEKEARKNQKQLDDELKEAI